MSVTITVRVAADPEKAAAFAEANAAMIRAISQQGKSMGAIHHRFVSRDGEIMVIDEWPDSGTFERFFEANETQIGPMFEAAGK